MSHCIAGGKDPVPLVLEAIGRMLCDDVRRGKSCPHHEQKARAIYEAVLHTQRQEREKAAAEALERLAVKP
jgi:hypothetical protein